MNGLVKFLLLLHLIIVPMAVLLEMYAWGLPILGRAVICYMEAFIFTAGVYCGKKYYG